MPPLVGRTRRAFLSWLEEFALEAFLSLLALATVSGVLVVAIWKWPDGWEPAAQATLAGVLVTGVVAMASIFVKALFDRLQQRSQHEMAVRERLLEVSYQYACDYLMPFAGGSAELARYLYQHKNAPDDSAHMDGVFHATALYVRMHNALLGTHPIQGMQRPLGLMLHSEEAEETMWNITMPPWALGILSPYGEALLIHSLLREDGHPRAPHEFIKLSRTPSSELGGLRQEFEVSLGENPRVDKIITVLRVQNELLNREVRRMLSGWYPRTALDHSDLLKKLSILSDDDREALGLFWDPFSQSR